MVGFVDWSFGLIQSDPRKMWVFKNGGPDGPSELTLCEYSVGRLLESSGDVYLCTAGHVGKFVTLSYGSITQRSG